MAKKKETTTVHPGGRAAPPASTDEHETELRRGSAPTVARLEIVSGPGQGRSFPVLHGQNSVGRGDQNAINLDFGNDSDDRISRDQPMLIQADAKARTVLLTDRSSKNAIQINGTALAERGSRLLITGDSIAIGATTLRITVL